MYLIGFFDDAVDRERRATARVAVHLGEDHAGDAERAVEALRDLHRVLAGHAVGDEQDLVGLDRLLEALELVHHLVVDLQAAGGVDDHDAVARALRLRRCRAFAIFTTSCVVALGVHRDVELLPERLELVDGGGAVDVGGDEPRRASFGLELARELGGGGRLSGALQPDHHDDGRRDGAELEPLAPLAEHGGELVVDDLDELLRGRDGAQLRDADGLLLDALEELARELEVDVGLEEDAAHFAQPFLDVGFGENAAPAEAGEGRLRVSLRARRT